MGGAGWAFLLQMSHSWKPSVCLGEGEEGEMAGPPPRAGQLLPCQRQEVIWCVVALGAPGPPAKCLETAYLGQEGLEGQRVGQLLWGGGPLSVPSQGHG